MALTFCRKYVTITLWNNRETCEGKDTENAGRNAEIYERRKSVWPDTTGTVKGS